MNYLRIVVAGLAGTAAYFVLGGLLFGLVPQLRDQFRKYPSVYRDQEGIKSVMPLGMAGMLLSIVVLAVIYALVYRGGSGALGGRALWIPRRPVCWWELLSSTIT